MSSPASLTCRYLSPLKALWKLRHACLTSLVLDRCALWSAALLYTSFQISWDIQDSHTFIGRGALETYPFRTTEDAPPLGLGTYCLQQYWPTRPPPLVTAVTYHSFSP